MSTNCFVLKFQKNICYSQTEWGWGHWTLAGDISCSDLDKHKLHCTSFSACKKKLHEHEKRLLKLFSINYAKSYRQNDDYAKKDISTDKINGNYPHQQSISIKNVRYLTEYFSLIKNSKFYICTTHSSVIW